jgi:hypothetical protein
MLNRVTEISQLAKPLGDMTELLKKLAGPAFDEFGGILGDNVRVYRVKNLLKTMEKTNRILESAGLPPSPVSSRLLLPIIDSCSTEDDEDLQQKWAGLLASASQDSDSLSPSFVDTLKQLTPREAQHWDRIRWDLWKMYKRAPAAGDSIPYGAFTDAWQAPSGALETYERLGLIRRDYRVKIQNAAYRAEVNQENVPLSLLELQQSMDQVHGEIEYQFCFTSYAIRFSNACHGPKANDKSTGK